MENKLVKDKNFRLWKQSDTELYQAPYCEPGFKLELMSYIKGRFNKYQEIRRFLGWEAEAAFLSTLSVAQRRW